MHRRAFTMLLCLVSLLPVAVTPVAAQTDSRLRARGFRLFDHELLATDPVCIP